MVGWHAVFIFAVYYYQASEIYFMSRILFITPYPISRIRIRSFGFVSQLAKQHTVTVLALCTGEKDMADMWSLQDAGVTIIAVQEQRTQQYLRSLSVLGSQTPLQVAFGASPKLRAAILQQLATGQYDLVHIEFVRALGALPDDITVPVVWDAVDCISQLYEKGAQFGATSMLRIIGKYEAQRIRAYEYQQLSRFQHALITSERDRQALLELATATTQPGGAARPIADIAVIPHGIDREYFQPYTGAREPETLVFSGKMSFHANVAGIMHLVDKIMPLIWQQRPHVQLVLAGSKPPDSIRKLARDPRIKVTGYVADLRPYIARAQVALSPLPYAVGIQNKVLEAMALGTPVVASSHASAGLQVEDGKDICIADEPEVFAATVLRLLADRAMWDTISRGGVDYVTTHHNWETILEQLATLYTQAIRDASALEQGKKKDSCAYSY